MGSKDKVKKKSGGGHNLKVRCKDNPPTAPTCHCPPISTSPFPYKEFPPPAPPDGRSDLWDLQFCRWWGWNWVRKRESAMEASCRSDERRKSNLSSKCRTIEEEQFPVKDGCCEKMPPPLPKSKKPCKRYEPTPATCQKQWTPKEQFKVMCKCLLGKKNTPCGMAKLYNTPSASVMTFTKQKRITYGVCDTAMDETLEKPTRICQGEISEERCCKAKPWTETKPMTESTTAFSRHSITENSEDVPCESLYSHRNESSTEDSVEYLTVRLQHVTSDSACPCQKHPCAASKTKEFCIDERNQTEPITIICPKKSKETQTCPAAAEKKKVPPIDECLCSEKLIKLKGKKHKTICIMVCCCSACKRNNAPNPPENSPSRCAGCEKQETECSCKKCPKVCWQDDKNSALLPEKQTDKGSRNFGDLTTLPLAPFPVSAKKLSKFGTPSKAYPWMQSTESAGTTVSLSNIANRTNPSAISDIYEWLNPDFDGKNATPTSKLPDLIGITEDLSYLKNLDSSKKSSAEDRILLDAVCDAILQEHDDKTCQFLDEFQLGTKKSNYRELGVVCNLKSDHNPKSDVYTELSRALVNQEDVGVQLSATRNLDALLNQPDVNRLDNMMNNIMNNIFSESKDNVTTKPNNESFASSRQSKFNFGKRDAAAFTKTGLIPYQAATMFRKTTKRGATEPGDREYKKKVKQDDPKPNGDQTNERIGHIFSKIDDIVQKSKVKTAEIHKVLSCVPKPPESTTTGQANAENTGSKRNYPMSSDTFKGIICDEVAKHFDPLNMKKSYNHFNNSNEDNEEITKPALEEREVSNIMGKDDNENNTCKDKDNVETVKKKLSKLSVHNFVVCDEKSKSEAASPGTSSGPQSVKKRDYGRTSLIPVRKRSSTE